MRVRPPRPEPEPFPSDLEPVVVCVLGVVAPPGPVGLTLGSLSREIDEIDRSIDRWIDR